MNVIIRADASIYIGSGHIMRCLVLANALREQGFQVAFASRPQQGDLIDYIRNKGFIVHELLQPDRWLKPSSNADYQAWLQVSWQQDAENLIECVADTDLLVVDHYGIGPKWEKKVKTQLKCKLFVIDDLVRAHDADLLLDQTLMRDAREYQSSCTANNILTGCEFALLAPQFSRYREDVLDISDFAAPPKILVTMGGTDQPNATLSVLKALEYHPHPRPEVTVLLSRKAPNYNRVKSYCDQQKSWIKHIIFAENMAELMLNNTLVIGAPGTTSWERACLGTPSIIIPLAENQKTISKNLVKANATLCVDINEIPTKLLTTYYSLLKQWSEYRKANLQICDGLGANRVTHKINTLFDSEKKNFSLKIATQLDIKQVYEWQCQPETRQYALSPEIPSWNEHRAWMIRKLECANDYFYIIEQDVAANSKVSVGVLRLDRMGNAQYLISIFIDAKLHRRGIARQALLLIDVIHPTITIEATVLADNIASQKLFESANYQRLSQSSLLRLPI